MLGKEVWYRDMFKRYKIPLQKVAFSIQENLVARCIVGVSIFYCLYPLKIYACEQGMPLTKSLLR